jgi:hypothetical protein
VDTSGSASLVRLSRKAVLVGLLTVAGESNS